MSVAPWSEPISAWRHARAVALLPFMSTVVVPSALVLLWPPAPTLQWASALAGSTLLGRLRTVDLRYNQVGAASFALRRRFDSDSMW